jgi:hypothetical protein
MVWFSTKSEQPTESISRRDDFRVNVVHAFKNLFLALSTDGPKYPNSARVDSFFAKKFWQVREFEHNLYFFFSVMNESISDSSASITAITGGCEVISVSLKGNNVALTKHGIVFDACLTVLSGLCGEATTADDRFSRS